MSDPADNLVLEQLRLVRAELSQFRETVAHNTVELGAMGQQLAALTTAVYSKNDRIDALTRRVERIERRLELIDDAD